MTCRAVTALLVAEPSAVACFLLNFKNEESLDGKSMAPAQQTQQRRQRRRAPPTVVRYLFV